MNRYAVKQSRGLDGPFIFTSASCAIHARIQAAGNSRRGIATELLSLWLPSSESTAKVSSSVNGGGQHIQMLLQGRRIRGCERCLVEPADDRLRRAPRQKDGEPGWRLKIRRPLLMSGGQIGKAAYTIVRGDVISSQRHSSKER